MSAVMGTGRLDASLRLAPPIEATSAASSTSQAVAGTTNRALTKRNSLYLPPEIPLEEWRRIGDQILAIANSSTWWIGDWLVYGQAHYPDRYMRALEQTALDYQTLRNYAWIARRYPVRRRRAGLSFQHHAELASIVDDRIQDEWLDRAERFSWSRNKLRERLKASRSGSEVESSADTDDSVANVRVQVPPGRKQRWIAAATSARQDLGSWMVATLDAAATAIEGSCPPPSALQGDQAA